MSSFGSQARLAELTAAAAARERQAKRELEEEHKAPKKNPISLSAFTRPPVTSRNKGNKPFKPLVLDDIEEQDPGDSVGGDGASSVSDFETSTSASITRPSSANTRRVILTPRIGHPRVRLEHSMTALFPMRPHFPMHPTFTHMQHPMHAPHMHSVTHSAPPDAQHGQLSHYMVPEDISPTKQEEKFMEMQKEQKAAEEERNRMAMLNGTNHHEQADSVFSGGQPFENLPQNVYSHEMELNDPHLFEYPDHRLSNSPASDSESDITHDTPTGQGMLLRSSKAHHTQPQCLSHEEPFDTTKAMQRYIAEDKAKAMARRGKTVVASRESQCDDASEYDESEYEVFPPPGIRSQSENTDTTVRVRSSTLENAVRNPAPGLPFPLDIGPPDLTDAEYEESEEDKAWRERMARLRSDPNFMDLNPPNAKDRQRGREAMAKAERSLTVAIPDYYIHSDENENRLEASVDWFETDHRGAHELRDNLEFEVLAEEAMRRRRTAAAGNEGNLPSNFKVGVDDGIAINLALAHVTANLATYVFPSTEATNDMTSAQRRNFHRVKPVPDWAIAQTNEEKASYFGDMSSTTSTRGSAAWMQPPQRVARDPRFRPIHNPNITPASNAPVTPNRPIGGNGRYVGVIGSRRPQPANGPREGHPGHWQQRVDSLFDPGRR